jgi:hypothetical protein
MIDIKPGDVASMFAALASLASIINIAFTRRNKKKLDDVHVLVNSNVEKMLDILSHASVTLPHDTASKVIAAAVQPDPPPDETIEETIAREFLAKLKP